MIRLEKLEKGTYFEDAFKVDSLGTIILSWIVLKTYWRKSRRADIKPLFFLSGRKLLRCIEML